MKKILGIAFGMMVWAGPIVAKDIRCVCNDRSVIRPDCGICGVESGTMALTDDGVECLCANQLKLKDISCAAVCKDHEGWTGKFIA